MSTDSAEGREHRDDEATGRTPDHDPVDDQTATVDPTGTDDGDPHPATDVEFSEPAAADPEPRDTGHAEEDFAAESEPTTAFDGPAETSEPRPEPLDADDDASTTRFAGERPEALDADVEPTVAAPVATSGATTTAGRDDADEPAPPVSDAPASSAPVSDDDGTDDESLRQERARRFGRFGTRTEPAATDADADAAEPATTAMPADEPAPAATAVGAPATRTTDEPEPKINEDNPFEDWDDPPRSRAVAHWWVVLFSIVLTPVAWYLLADGGERWSTAREVSPEAINVLALAELAGGIVVLFALLLAVRWSSVGPIIVGSITTLIGGAFLAVPQIVEDFLADYSDIFGRLGQLGQNVYDHLLVDGNSGRLLAYGVVLIMAGVISHGARRQGRREERRRAAAEAL